MGIQSEPASPPTIRPEHPWGETEEPQCGGSRANRTNTWRTVQSLRGCCRTRAASHSEAASKEGRSPALDHLASLQIIKTKQKDKLLSVRSAVSTTET